MIFNGKFGIEIGRGEDKHTVDLEKEIYTCRSWDLTGILCLYTVKAIYYDDKEPEDFMSIWYRKDTYLKT